MLFLFVYRFVFRLQQQCVVTCAQVVQITLATGTTTQALNWRKSLSNKVQGLQNPVVFTCFILFLCVKNIHTNNLLFLSQ